MDFGLDSDSDFSDQISQHSNHESEPEQVIEDQNNEKIIKYMTVDNESSSDTSIDEEGNSRNCFYGKIGKNSCTFSYSKD